MANPKETAEQKLLKLIEATEGPQAPAASSAPDAPSASEAQKTLQSVSAVGIPSVSLPPFLAKALSSLQGFLFSGKPPSAFGIREFNKIFILVLIVVGIICVREFIGGMKNSQQKMNFSLAGNAGKSSPIVLPTVKDLTEYLTMIQRRNIFQPYQPPKAEEPLAQEQAAPVEVKVLIDEQVKDLKLVGISWLDSSESATAMIEDAKSGVTNFYKTGDPVAGVKIETIFADRVILEYEGEKFDLKLY